MSDSTTTKIRCPVCISLNWFETETNGISSYLCLRCGMTTNSHFKDGSPQLKSALEKSPEIIQSLQ